MNENPGEMPNPLNPNNNPLDANPAESQPLEEIVEEVQTVNVTPAEQPVNAAPVEQPVNAAPAGEPVVDPMARPMEKAPVVEPVQPKKKKTGLIVAGIIAAVVAVGCGVAAAIIFAMNSGDPVAKALEKIANGNMPAFAAIEGDITVTPNDTSMISNMTISLNSQASTSSMLNNTKATVTTNFAGGDAIDFSVEEMYSTNGDLYLKLNNVADALEGFATAVENNANETTLNTNSEDACIEDENGNTVCDEELVGTLNTTNDVDALGNANTLGNTSTLGNPNVLGSMLGSFGGAIELVDGVWLKVSADEISSLTNSVNMNSEATCLAGVMADVNKYKNSTIQVYNKSPFISSTTDGVALASKGGQPVRKIVIDKEKFSTFAEGMKSSDLANALRSCSSASSEEALDVSSLLNNAPTVYVEVDGDYNFSRVAFEGPITNTTKVTTSCVCDDPYDCPCDDEEETTNEANLSVDLSISYPDTINMVEPSDSKDLSSLLQQLFMMMYSTQGTGTDYSTISE